jgi:hypothetical protein
MKKLSQLLESINEIDSLLELDFKDKKAFQKYQSIHKMKPTTKVNIAGKDTTVGDETDDDSQTPPEAPKKMTGKDVDNKAVANAKAQDDIEKDIAGDDFDDRDGGADFDLRYKDLAGDEPKSDEPVKLDDYAQEAIDGMDWNKYFQPNDENIARKVIKNLNNSTDEYNAQINLVYNELDGQIPQEDLDKLDDATVPEDEDLSDVPREELEKKAQILVDFHKKYSTQATKSDEPTTKFQGRTIPKAPKYDTKKKTTSKKPSALDSYYAKEDAKKKWLSSNSGKTSYDWSRLPYGTKSDLIDKEMRAKGFKENINLEELSKITTRYTNRIDEAGFPNQLRRGFIDHSKSSAHGYAIEEVDAILKVYKEITELLTYGKFYDDKKPNKRRYDLSALVADINTAVIGQKRLGGYQNRFEGIFKKFTNMINTQLKREEKGQKADYIKAIRASQLDQVKSIFKNSTMTSVRKQKDLY